MAPKKEQDIFKLLKKGDPDAISSFLEGAKGKVHERNKRKQTPLHLASEDGDLGCVEVLLNFRADANACDAEGKTPLHLAVQRGYDDIIPQLLLHGASPLSTDSDGMNSLHWAARMGYPEIAQCLLGEVDLGEDLGEDADGNPKKSKIVPVDKLELISAEDKDGNTALHLAVSEPDSKNLALYFLKTTKGKGEACKTLINAKNKEGCSPLHLACSTGVGEVVTELAALGASPAELTNSGENALHTAILGGDMDLIGTLLGMEAAVGDEEGAWAAFLNCQDKAGNTPLHLCSQSGNAKALQEILKNKDVLKLDLKNKAGAAPILLAHKGKHTAVVTLLKDSGADDQCIADAIAEDAAAAQAKAEEPKGDYSGAGKKVFVPPKRKKAKKEGDAEEKEESATEGAGARAVAKSPLVVLLAFSVAMLLAFYLVVLRK